ncbi:MAG TPA: ECF-type sigma factor [Burkholderiales bacterium]|nr:ECF-type sigma factor [Burkholderiales bacterium]
MPTELSEKEEVTAMLHAWMAGETGALDRLMATVQAEMRRLARVHMRRERRDHTLQPTALVNEIYLRLVDLRAIRWQDRAHFYNMVSTLMRRVLVDAARARAAGKRRRSRMCVTFNDARLADPKAAQDFDMLALNEVLTRLAAIDERKARVVELRFFGGLNVEETAGTLGVSVETVARDWRTAKIWLRREMAREAAS